MISLKKVLVKLLNRARIDGYVLNSEFNPIVTGWDTGSSTVDYSDVLPYYRTVYVLCHVYGVRQMLTFVRGDDSTETLQSQWISDYYSGTYGRMRVDVRWSTGYIGISAIDGATDQMGILGVWFANHV